MVATSDCGSEGTGFNFRQAPLEATQMVKVLDPDGIIIGVYETAKDVPKRLPNRMHSHYYRRSECEIVEVTDPKDFQRLLPSIVRKDRS